MIKRLFLLLCLAGFASLVGAAVEVDSKARPFWPGVNYDTAIPTFKDVLGYEAGERISTPEAVVRYFEALEKAAPDRIKLFRYAQSWEGRPLIYAAIASPKNLADLEVIAADTGALADPRETSDANASGIIDRLPASVWLQYAVHGNEISGSDAAMFTAYHLLAAGDHEVSKSVLDNTVVFIDPLQNPDGRARFTSRYYATVGLAHSADGISAEQNEPWPQGRFNHYLFDMNRDWLAITQPETKGKIAALNRHLPQVVVDIHEMDGDQSYYFAPAAKPFNPFMTQAQIANMDAIGKNHARHFDRFGFDYFTREIFDAFYPGYGDSWPTFYGASASTYEIGSARGHRYLRKDGSVLTYADTVRRQFVASLSTAEGTALAREKILRDFYEYQVGAIAQGRKSSGRVYLMPNQRNREGNQRLATLMAQHGVEVRRATADFSACGVSYSAGSYFIDTAQPRGRFVATTFTDQVDMTEAFLKEQERRRARNLGDEIYDVTGWSLPMMFNVQTNACSRAVSVDSVSVGADDPLQGMVKNAEASVAFLVPWRDMASGRFLTAALQAGISLKSADEAFVLDGGARYPAGSLVIEVSANEDNLVLELQRLAQQTGAIIEGVDTSWVTEGPSFGSDKAVKMLAPKVAMAWDEPASATSAGNTRFVIERQLGYPVTAIRSDALATGDLSRYDVLVLPEGNYADMWGEEAAENLIRWVEGGGVLLAFGRANRFLTDTEVGLLNIKREYAYREDSADTDADADDESSEVTGSLLTSREALSQAIIESETAPDRVSGVLANIDVDQEHWLTAGVDPQLVTLAAGNDIYTPIKLDSGKNLAWFADEANLLASGYLWAENRAQLAHKPFLVHQPIGDGMVIAFTQTPTYRAYLEGLNLLLTNSIFRAAAHARAN